MAEVTWGSLAKTIDNKITVSEEIDADILEHNEDPSAHGQAGEALDVHKSDDPIDHPNGSVTEPKIADGAVGGKIVFYGFPNSEIFIEEGLSSGVAYTDIALATYIPTTAKAVIVSIMSNDGNGKRTRFSVDAKGGADTQGYILTVENNGDSAWNAWAQGIVKVGTDRKLRYKVTTIAGMSTDAILYLVAYIK